VDLAVRVDSGIRPAAEHSLESEFLGRFVDLCDLAFDLGTTEQFHHVRFGKRWSKKQKCKKKQLKDRTTPDALNDHSLVPGIQGSF